MQPVASVGREAFGPFGHPGVATAQRGEHDAGEVVRIGDRRELDQPDGLVLVG